MNKNILQCVSGGYDSTYLIIKNLEAGDNVYPVYIHSNSVNSIKQHIELSNLKHIIKKIQERNINLKNLIEVNLKIGCMQGIISLQPILWLLGLFNEVKNGDNEYDEVHIGYIMNDSAVSYLQDIKYFWKSLFGFSYGEYKIPNIMFPLVKTNKETVLNELRKYDIGVFYACWTCELPNVYKSKRLKDGNIEVLIEPCGTCKPCLTIKSCNNISFNLMNKYKVLINTIVYLSDIKVQSNEVIKNIDFLRIPHKFISIDVAEENEYRNEKATRKNNKRSENAINEICDRLWKLG